jgi:hypothetical protein
MYDIMLIHHQVKQHVQIQNQVTHTIHLTDIIITVDGDVIHDIKRVEIAVYVIGHHLVLLRVVLMMVPQHMVMFALVVVRKVRHVIQLSKSVVQLVHVQVVVDILHLLNVVI